MPHKTATDIAYDSGDFAQVMDECLKLADWNGFGKRAAASKKNGKLRGRGICYFLEEAVDLQRPHGRCASIRAAR